MAAKVRSNRPVNLVYVSTAVVWASYSLLTVTLPFRFHDLGLSVVQYGVAVAAFAFGMLATESLWGILAFRIGNARAVIALGAAVVGLYVAIGLFTDFVALVVALALFGALVIYAGPLFRWMAMVAGGPGTAGTGTGRYGFFFGIGMVAGSALGPLLYVSEGFQSLMEVVIGTYLVGLGLMVALPWKEARLPRSEPTSLSTVRRVMTKPFVYVSCLVMLAYLILTLVVNFLQIYSVSEFHGTAAEAGYVIGSARATLLVAGVLLGSVVDRYGPMRSAPFGFLLLAGGIFGTLLSTSYVEMVASTLVFATGVGWLTVALLPLALGPIPLPLQGTAVGVFGSFEDLGLLLGPILISVTFAAYGVRFVFVLVGAVALVGALLALLAPWIGTPASHANRLAPTV